MNIPNICPKCGAILPADAPEGLCPACLMSGAFPTGAGTVKMSPSQKPGASEPTTPTPEELSPLFPQLEILELLGRGGMGAVYKVRQKTLNRIVALKILPVEAGADEHFAERFQREAQALARLNHPNIVTVYEVGESNGLFYFLMEFVDGANLRTLIRSGEMKPEAALALIPAFCDALQYAHDEGVVHRDIKPENVLVNKKGHIKIADFGLAKLLGHETTDHALTRTGMYLGTPRYMAPEQVDKPETVDHRADIYSLGVVFYEMLTGEIPMGRFAPPSQKVQVDVRFDEIVLHALERDVTLRYQHASEIKTDVENVTGKPQTVPAPFSVPTVPLEPCLSRFALWGAIWAVLGLLAATVIRRLVVLDWDTQSAGLRHPVIILHMHVFLWALFFASSAVGSTAFGAIAIGKIRRSSGKIYGLPLAAFDALLFPLLALGCAAFAVTHLTQIALWTQAHMGYSMDSVGHRVNPIAPDPVNLPIMAFMFLDALIPVVICFFAGRVVWRKIFSDEILTTGNLARVTLPPLTHVNNFIGFFMSPSSGAVSAVVAKRLGKIIMFALILLCATITPIALNEIIGTIVNAAKHKTPDVSIGWTIGRMLIQNIAVWFMFGLAISAIVLLKKARRGGQIRLARVTALCLAGAWMLALSAHDWAWLGTIVSLIVWHLLSKPDVQESFRAIASAPPVPSPESLNQKSSSTASTASSPSSASDEES